VYFVKLISRISVENGDYKREDAYQVIIRFEFMLERKLTEHDFTVLSDIARGAYAQGVYDRLRLDRPHDDHGERPIPFLPNDGDELFSGYNRDIVVKIAQEAYGYGEADQRSVSGSRSRSDGERSKYAWSVEDIEPDIFEHSEF
jgi:hypothetical protein